MRSGDLRGLGSTGLRARRCAAFPRAGLAIVEIVVALSVLIVAASIFCQMLLSTSHLRQLNRENALAADAARVVLERMRNETFLQVYKDYNEDASDDPGGKGTGPGHLFDVSGLAPLEDAEQGKVGRVMLPSKEVEIAVQGGKVGVQGGGQTEHHWQLHEDVELPALGMPRDLNGNNVVDSADHSADYLLLPVEIEIRWKSGTGLRKFTLVTQLADYSKAGEE